MLGSGAEAECLKPGWPRRSPRAPPPAPRHGKADLLSYHCSSVAPASNAQPPPGTAAHAADTVCGGGQPRACDPSAAPGMGGCSYLPPPVCQEAQHPPQPLTPSRLVGRKSPSIREGTAGRGDSVSPTGTAAGTGCCGPRGAAVGKCWGEGDHSPWASGARVWFESPGQAEPLHSTQSPSTPQPSPRPVAHPPACWGAGFVHLLWF